MAFSDLKAVRTLIVVLLLLTSSALSPRDATAQSPRVENSPAQEAPIRPTPPRLQLPLQDQLRIAVLTTFAVVWFFWLGAAMGSYLNVVVYRMPLGLASVAPNSSCPNCHTPIRWFDNIPIYSWLALRGRCRACHTAISPRYLYVELIVGSLFLLLMCVEVLTGGANLPVRPHRVHPGLPMIEHFMNWQLVGVCFYHAALAWFLTGLTMFRWDRHRLPAPFIATALIVGLVPPLVWPDLRPLSAIASRPEWLIRPLAGLVDGVLGFITGAAAGDAVALGAVWLIFGRFTRRGFAIAARELAIPLTIAGVFLGWQATLLIACIAIILLMAGSILRNVGSLSPRWPLAAAVTLATLVQLLGWSWLTDRFAVAWVPSWVILLLLIAACWADGYHRRRSRFEPSEKLRQPVKDSNGNIG